MELDKIINRKQWYAKAQSERKYDASGKLLLAQCRKCEKNGKAAIFSLRGCALHYSRNHHSHRLGWERLQNWASCLPCKKKGGWEECRTLKTKHAKVSANSLRVWKAMEASLDLPDPGTELASPALQADSLPLSHQGSPLCLMSICISSLSRHSIM